METKSVINRQETKTRRGNIFIRPSTWNAVQKILKVKRESFNNLVCLLLEEYVENNVDVIFQYDTEHKE